MNWTGTTWLSSGGSAQTINGVQSVKLDAGGSLAKFAGDGDRYNSLTVNDFNEPVMTIETADIAALNAMSIGDIGTFSTTWNDAKNATASGAITYTFLAVISNISFGGKHRQYGMGTLELAANSSDGTTSPLSFSVTA